MPIYRTDENSEHLQKVEQNMVRVYPFRSRSSKENLPYPFNYQIPSCFLPKTFERYADEFDNFKVRPDDIWIVTFPKSGTTWVMNIVWQLMNNLSFSPNNVLADYNFFENRMLLDKTKADNDLIKCLIKAREEKWHLLKDLPSPRMIKSHLPAQLLPKDIWTVKPKIIYVCRDPKDTAISMYHFLRNANVIQYSGTLEEFCDLFMNDQLSYTPFCSHINSYHQLNGLDNILFLRYEELKSNSFAEVKKINDFLGYKYTDDQLKQLTEYVSFKNMQQKNNGDPVLFHGFK